MMDLRVSVVVLLLIFITGGYSLRCYTYVSGRGGSCEAKEEICPVGFSKCESKTMEQSIGSTKKYITAKQCGLICEPGTKQLSNGESVTTHCCDTDLCNAADGLYKGSFLLLLSPVLFYFLFQ